MTTRHVFETTDLDLAGKIHALIVAHSSPQTARSPAIPTLSLVQSPVVPATIVETPAAVAAPPPPPPPTSTPPAPPAAVVAPEAPATPTMNDTPPPPPAPPPANGDLSVAPPGWTLDHMKSAAATFTGNPTKGGISKFGDMLRPYCPPGEPRPTLKKVYPAHWPALHALLTAA